MDCNEFRMSCQLERIADALESGPSGFEIAQFWVSLVSVVVTALIGVLALIISMQANSFAAKTHAAGIAAKSREDRRLFAADVKSWIGANMSNKLVGTWTETDLATNGGNKLTDAASRLDEPTALNLVRWGLITVKNSATFELGKGCDVKRAAEENIARNKYIDQPIDLWIDNPAAASALIDTLISTEEQQKEAPAAPDED